MPYCQEEPQRLALGWVLPAGWPDARLVHSLSGRSLQSASGNGIQTFVASAQLWYLGQITSLPRALVFLTCKMGTVWPVRRARAEGSANFFCKGSDAKYFRLRRPFGLRHFYLTLLLSRGSS